MSINDNIGKLRERIRNFLQVNDKVNTVELKLHLECPETDLLLALGGLVTEGLVDIERDGWNIIVKRTGGGQ
ncbi:MAG: hypothetical protein ABIH89_02855 [Elusimicrobiota bacterium]